MLKFFKASWWKYLSIVIILYSIVAGFLFPVPELPILNETIRSQYFHVPLWFAMVILMLISMIFSIYYLRKGDLKDDLIAVETAKVSILFGVLGLVTGMIWANYTWGDWWHGDPKQNAAAIAMLIYLAYLVLRNSMPDLDKRGRISAVFNIFAFFAMIALIFIVPRLTDSLHPGAEGNPGFSAYDLDNNMRMVFYPAVFGWIFFGLWMASIGVRVRDVLNQKLNLY